jgi:hypothetical protein
MYPPRLNIQNSSARSDLSEEEKTHLKSQQKFAHCSFYLRLYDLAIFSVIIVLSLFLQLVQNASIEFEVREYGKSMRDFANFLIQTIKNRGIFFLIPRCCKTAVHIY